MSKFVIRGTRGTIPACGTAFVKYGGDTTCYTVETDEGIIIIDAGTGLSLFGREIAAQSTVKPITMLFTHFHLDHVVGLPCFYPIYKRETSLTIMADPRRPEDWKHTLRTFMGRPYWPVGIRDVDALMAYDDLPVDDEAFERYGLRVSWFRVPHPQQCLAYRIELPHGAVVVATDVEYQPDTVNPEFVAFCQGADHLIFDSQYTPEEYPVFKGWGHSTWETATAVAQAAGVKQLILTHHAPERNDAGVDAIVTAAQSVFRDTVGAVENMILTE